MREANDHIKKLFSDFEPEVNDAKLEESWEKMTYFLPAEKKRRPAFYFMSCLGIIGGLLLLISSAVVFYNYRDVQQATAQKTAVARHPVAEEVRNYNKQPKKNGSPAGKTAAGQLPEGNDTHKDIITVNNKTTIAGNQNGLSLSKIDKAEPAIKHTAVTENDDHETLPVQPPVASHAAQAVLANDNNNNSFGNSADTIGSASETIYLPVYAAQQPAVNNDSIKETPLVNLTRPSLPVHGQFKIQLFGGPEIVYTKLNDLTYNVSQDNAMVHASAGLALSYQFLNKISVTGQFVYAGNQIDHRQLLIQSIDLPNQPAPITNFAERIYIKAYTGSKLTAGSSYNIAAGLGYQFYQGRRLGINAMMLFNLRTVNYSYNETRTLGTKEMTYIPGVSEIPPAAPADFQAAEINEKLTVHTTALVPGLVLDYQLAKRYAVIFRPSYYFQSPADHGGYKNLFRIRQHMLCIDFGVQFKW